jgi:hypothetical protein
MSFFVLGRKARNQNIILQIRLSMACLPLVFGIMSKGITRFTSVQAPIGYTCRRNQNARISDGSTPLQPPLPRLFHLDIQWAMMSLTGVIHPFWTRSHQMKWRWFHLYLCNHRRLISVARLRNRVQVPPVCALDLLHGEIARRPHLFLDLASLLPVFICHPLPVVPAPVPIPVPLTCLLDTGALHLGATLQGATLLGTTLQGATLLGPTLLGRVVPTTFIIKSGHLPAQVFVSCPVLYEIKCPGKQNEMCFILA